MKKTFIIVGILLIIFFLIMGLVLTDNITAFDDAIYNFLINLRCKGLDIYFKEVTKLGNTITILCIVILLLIYLKKDYALMLGLSTIASVTFNTIIKYIIRCPRPMHLRLITQGGYSFPSGHSMISVCVYGFLIYLIFKEVSDRRQKVLLIIFFSILIISIGLSRIYVGVHYPSDVIAGYLLASSLLITIITIYNKYFRGKLNGKNSCK